MASSNIRTTYNDKFVPEYMASRNIKTTMAVPKIAKVSVSMGLGSVKENDKEREELVREFVQIVGQAAVVTKARKSIAGFNIREGMEIGVKATLRGRRMDNFLEKIFNYVLPRTRDFRGLPASGFDGNGNYSFGIDDQMIFLEIDPNKVRRRQGLQVTIVTTANTDEDAKELLLALGLPLQKEED
ncbi:50S ribosomal protein L5 [candidate division WWE3 bacterium]|uniref:Large ribosomal subunit protein uL5 n=1 Tax=candidate division WWE3 bacterium TaxID=2053526 RepID=A0A955LKL5_UNCKA|nr:50S ribosomal protein L5 [candidate division WWE3 bacterium]